MPGMPIPYQEAKPCDHLLIKTPLLAFEIGLQAMFNSLITFLHKPTLLDFRQGTYRSQTYSTWTTFTYFALLLLRSAPRSSPLSFNHHHLVLYRQSHPLFIALILAVTFACSRLIRIRFALCFTGLTLTTSFDAKSNA